MWSGVISFGMVSIPVKLHTATRAKDISFNLLHATCGTRIQQKRWCPTDEVEVPWDEIVRGYAYTKDKYVTLTDEDFEKLPLPSRQTVAISAFVRADEIDPVYYEKSYYLSPGERGEKPYALLLKALDEKGLVAIATITIRKKEQLCALRPHNGTLLLDTLYYPDEVTLSPEVDVSKAKLTAEELKMAYRLVELLEKPFDPSEYHDTYREALGEPIDAKLEGREIVTAPPREAKVIDLREALARSVQAAKEGGGRTAKRSGRTRKAAAKSAAKRPHRKGERKAG
jgi:DNA end-binding protein Ku